MNVVAQCRAVCKQAPQRIIFADAQDIRVLRAANELQQQGLAIPILIGNPFELRDYADRAGLAMPNLSIVDPLRSGHLDEFVDAYLQDNPDKFTRPSVQQFMSLPLFYAGMMLHLDHGDICIAGNLSTTSDVLRAALRVIGVAEQHETVSSFFLMSSPDESDVRVFADAGVVPKPSVAQLADIAIDAAASFEKLTGETARVAMLSFSTKGSSDHPSAKRVRDAFELVQRKSPNLIVDGELQFDAATVPEVAAQKSPDSPLQGKANVLVFPSLDAGNIAYKVAQRLSHYQALGPLLQGLKKPMHDLSRGCSADDIVNIAILASRLAKQ